MIDELTTNTAMENIKLTKVPLNRDKQIYLIRAFEYDYEHEKKYMRSAGFLVQNELLTTTFSDTIHFVEELNLFNGGNSQNKYLMMAEHNSVDNLKLRLEDATVYISKSEAKAICRIFNMSLSGYSMTRVLEFEYRFTPESLTQAMFQNDYLALPKDDEDEEDK